MTRWGLVTTILAPTRDILNYAAYHLEAGAHRLYLYLDQDHPEAFPLLKAHPKIRVAVCDEAHWKKLRGTPPPQHQVRQSLNATHAYHRRIEVDWLIHMDVDEFLVCPRPVSDVLDALPQDVKSARTRPMELLAGGDGTAYKTFLPGGPERSLRAGRIYPTFGEYMIGGFLSHVAGKIFLRTGIPSIDFRIHNAFQYGHKLDAELDPSEIDLAHAHAKTWDQWRRAFEFRIEKGSYRPDMKASANNTGMNINALLTFIMETEGEPGLRAFYDEVAGDSPDLRARLKAEDALRIVDLDLDALRKKHFPDWVAQDI